MTKHIINHTRRLDCLEILRSHVPSAEMPAWVIDWNNDSDSEWVTESRLTLYIHPRNAASIQDLTCKEELDTQGLLIGMLAKCRRAGEEHIPIRVDFFVFENQAVTKLIREGSYDSYYVNFFPHNWDPTEEPIKAPCGVYVPRAASPGDLLVHLKGSEMAFIVRPSPAATKPPAPNDKEQSTESALVGNRVRFIGPAVFWQHEGYESRSFYINTRDLGGGAVSNVFSFDSDSEQQVEPHNEAEKGPQCNPGGGSRLRHLRVRESSYMDFQNWRISDFDVRSTRY